MMRRNSITRQAAIRLCISITLLVGLVAVSSFSLYRTAQHKTTHERAEELVLFYTSRLNQIEQEWEMRSRDFKVRIESSRALEEESTAVANLQAFLTIQGADRPFQYLLIQSRDGRKLFDFGHDISLEAIPSSAEEPFGHYLDPNTQQLYRVIEHPIWLGPDQGMGRFAVFIRIDNALLNQMTTPGLTLSVLHQGKVLASSGGQADLDAQRLEALRRDRIRDTGRESREIPWGGQADDHITLLIEAPVVTLFSTAEMSVGLSVIPIVDGLLLWLTIGLWLMRQTRRITQLGGAVEHYASAGRVTDIMADLLAGASHGNSDEIAEVAAGVETMVMTIDQRQQEREEAAKQLRASESRLREITSSLADGVLVVDIDGTISFVNPHAEELLGWTAGELIGRNSHETLHHQVPLAACLVHGAIRAGKEYRGEDEFFIRRDNSLLPIALAATPIRRDNQVVGAVVTFQDISERLAAKEALLESEMRFRTLFNSGGDAVLVHPLVAEDGGMGRFVEANEVACQRLGYSREELLTMTPLDLDEPGTYPDREQIKAFQAEALREGRLLFERTHMTSDGRRIPVEINAHVFELNNVKMMLSVVRDISERKRAEVEYRTILQTSVDGFWITSLHDARFLDVNPAYCAMTGYSREELLTMTVPDIEANEHPEETRAHVQAVIEGNGERFESRHRCKDGRIIDVEISAKFLDVHGGEIMVFVRDITERKLAETRLLEQRLRLNEAQRIAHVGSWELDFTSGALSWSDEIYRMFELDPAHFNASYPAFLERIHPDDRERVDQAFNAAVHDHTPYEIGHRLRMDDGRIKHVHEQGEIGYDSSGAPLRAAGTIQDVTERVLAEMALQQSEERLAMATRSGIIGIWDWDVVNDRLLWDAAMYRLYGLREGDFAGAYEAWSQALHPDDREHTEAEIQAALRGDQEYAPEFRVVWPDGSIHYLKASSQTIRDEKGRPLRMVGINYDQTELRQATQRIAELLDFNSTIISESTLGKLVYKVDGTCVLANEAAAQVTGDTVEQLLAQNFRQIPAWRKSGLLDAALRTLESGRKQHLETHLVTSDGRELWLSCDFIPLTRSGEPHLLLILNDVSIFRLAEQALNEAKVEAERANRAKSEFLANMSHEIRTPMNAIIGLSDLGLHLPAVPPKLHDYLAKIHTSSLALLSILNHILDYSKVEAGRLELEVVDFHLEEVLDNVSNLFGVHAEEKGLEMVFDVAPEVPGLLVGDPLRLGQVMNNLVGNAVKFTDKGEIHIKVEQTGQVDGIVTLRFSVRDTGIGMESEQVGRLFHAFTQADGSITRRFGGTGLGLTISKRLVEKMGGDIEVKSEKGAGSTFSFQIQLPLSKKQWKERRPDQLRGMRVLLVDDLETARLSLGEVLRAWGFEVTEADSGEAALALLQERGATPDEEFELLLLDWKMPGMNGVDVARHIHELAQAQKLTRPPVVIMVTAYSRDQLEEAAQGIQLDAILTKPVNASGLFDAIMEVQGGAHYPETSATSDLTLQAAALRGARVLLVEDNEINQTVARDLLERMELVVTVVGNGQQALDRLEGASFDVVLMDLQMPVMDGFEASRRIRADSRFQNLPIIAMTAAVLTKDREACRAAGMNDHVGKPILPVELLATLKKWLPPRPEAGAWRVLPKPLVPEIVLPDHLDGFDLVQVTTLLGGNSLLFIRLASQFAEQFALAAQTLGELLAHGDLGGAAALVHSIKGAAGNLGAIPLHRAATALEASLCAGESPDLSAFEQDLKEVLSSVEQLQLVQAAVLESADGECAQCDWQRATELFEELRQQVESYDYVPPETILELKTCIRCQPLCRQLEMLERHIRSTEYEKAKSVLNELTCAQGHTFKGADTNG